MRDDMDRQEYIAYALSQIDDNSVWWEIEKELSAHIDDREQYYLDCGYDSETAAKKAMEHMGSPEAAADGFSKVHIKSRLFTAILAVLALLSSVAAFLLFWFIIVIICSSDAVMGAGITEAMFLMFVVGLSVIGKRRNSRFICFISIIDFVIMYGRYVYELNYSHDIDELCSRIVLKLVCLLTGDFKCLDTFWQVGGITVASYLTKLSVAFYIAVLILLILVFISVCRLKKPTYGLRTKQFTRLVFKAQKTAWIFIASTMLILPVFGSFDKNDGMTVKTNAKFDLITIAQSDTPCPVSQIPQEDILIIETNYDWSRYIFDIYSISDNSNIIIHSDTENFEFVRAFHGDSIQKECGNKLKYKVRKFNVPCTVNKDYVYIKFTDLSATENINESTAHEFNSDMPENWYEVDSIGEISAAVDAYNQVEIIIEKSP